MKAFIYKTRRKKAGKLVKSRTWYACLKFADDICERRINLKVMDERVAEEKLRFLIREHESERAGLILPKGQRNALESPTINLIVEHVADLETMGRSEGHVRHVRTRLYRLVRENGWRRLRDVTTESFIRWRSAQNNKAAKTLNEYLASLSAFFSWLCKQNRLPVNPFVTVTKVDTRGKETFYRIALTDEQCRRLVEVSGARKLYYMMTLHTGLRRRELNHLSWDDLFLDAQQPFMIVRVASSKNRKQKSLPLHSELVECLHLLKPSKVSTRELVFPNAVPPMKVVREDFETAGISLTDGKGGRVDFHALRKTFVTRLQVAGVSARVAMELARHSEMWLTMNVYTDTSHLPLSASVQQLPRLGPIKDTPKDTPATVKTGSGQSTQVLIAKKSETVQPIENTMENHVQASPVTVSPSIQNGGERGIRTPVTAFDRKPV